MLDHELGAADEHTGIPPHSMAGPDQSRHQGRALVRRPRRPIPPARRTSRAKHPQLRARGKPAHDLRRRQTHGHNPGRSAAHGAAIQGAPVQGGRHEGRPVSAQDSSLELPVSKSSYMKLVNSRLVIKPPAARSARRRDGGRTVIPMARSPIARPRTARVLWPAARARDQGLTRSARERPLNHQSPRPPRPRAEATIQPVRRWPRTWTPLRRATCRARDALIRTPSKASTTPVDAD